MTVERNRRPNFSDSPGEYLDAVLSEAGITKGGLARRMRRPAAKLSAIIKQAKTTTEKTAPQLERALVVPAHVRMGLESEFRLVLARNPLRVWRYPKTEFIQEHRPVRSRSA